MAMYYFGSTLSNLASVVANHKMLVEEGGLQPIITLASSPDPDVHQVLDALLLPSSSPSFL